MELLRFDSNRTALWELHERLFPGTRIKRPAYRESTHKWAKP